MTRYYLAIVLTILSVSVLAQNKMRPADELINKAEPFWPTIKDWIKAAKNDVDVLPADTVKAKEALYKIQVTTRSPLGAVVYMTGGILIDNGWIRILGSGNTKLNRALPDWNKGKSFTEFGDAPSFYLIADDVIGGFFLLNGGGLGSDLGKVYYFSPDNLEYEPLGITYSGFLEFCFNGDLAKFYEGQRWSQWEDEVSKLDGSQVFSFYPFLWTKEGKDINKNSRKAVPVEEQYNLNQDFRKQLGIGN